MAEQGILFTGEIDYNTWPKPLTASLPEKYRKAYTRRCNALISFLGGQTVRAAAELHKADRRTLLDDYKKAQEPGPDGKILGFRACIPYQYRLSPSDESDTKDVAPTEIKKGPHAFTHLLRRLPEVKELLEKYSGPLPSGKRKCSSFDRLYSKFKSTVKEALGKESYPFDVPDKGRRAVLNYIKRIRAKRVEGSQTEIEEAPTTVKRVSQLFTLKPLDRIEFDGHKTDVDWKIRVPLPDGTSVLRHISCISLLIAIDAVSRYVLAYLLVFNAYNFIDVLRLFHRVLQPWTPRSLVVPNLNYFPGSCLGMPAQSALRGYRGIQLAGDNAWSHLANYSVENLTEYHHGILNFGRSYVPETRPIVEAFNRRLEEGALRGIAGGFHPATNKDPTKRYTSTLVADDHPLHLEGMHDLLDVIIAGSNVTEHSGTHGRKPVEVLTEFLHSPHWAFQCADPSSDADRITTIRINPFVRGSKDGKPPYVQYKNGIYRSAWLNNQHGLIGEPIPAELNLEDIRHMVLLNKDDGTMLSRLIVLPPWADTRHDLLLREKASQAKNRGLLNLAGSTDAIAAYHEFARDQAIAGNASADAYARTASLQSSRSSVPVIDRTTLQPRGGPVNLDNVKEKP